MNDFGFTIATIEALQVCVWILYERWPGWKCPHFIEVNYDSTKRYGIYVLSHIKLDFLDMIVQAILVLMGTVIGDIYPTLYFVCFPRARDQLHATKYNSTVPSDPVTVL